MVESAVHQHLAAILVSDAVGYTRLTQDEGNNESPSFSPDGHQIVFTSTRGPKRQKNIYIMDVDGNNQRRITRGGGYETPSWRPRRPID